MLHVRLLAKKHKIIFLAGSLLVLKKNMRYLLIAFYFKDKRFFIAFLKYIYTNYKKIRNEFNNFYNSRQSQTDGLQKTTYT